ncbi:neutral amino acid ABC transporter membrane protein [Rivularia sp. PCC 7116]|uniref:amino acid ABC transporter permease n=1 Tax=Rivularia sp. PCC 7116 TaxID=373994 RepID=UPI00029EC840|nr:amino acid ABC transporter permease [Rivularia sp. PCC 7116]AFY54503.1 neutral amino acid ABC transporter membrane protein [Rivularia sp. PCC 7116]
MNKNLFNTWYNSLFTIICLVIIFFFGWNLLNWIFTQAQWQVIEANLRLFMVGRYPQSFYWRVWISSLIASTLTFLTVGVFIAKQNISKITIIITAFLFGFLLIVLPVDINSRLWLIGIGFSIVISFLLGKKFAKSISAYLAFAWLLSFPIILYLIGGGLGLRSVSSSDWNGLLLTLLMAAISIALSFPIGILLALGRTSNLPVVKWFSILYIEIIRGLPLIGILFLAQVMLPLFLPIRLDRVLRGVAGLILFSAAYMAENVRGGLQSVPKGQVEAAKVLGLNPALVLLLIVLPQALRAVIPAIVGQFIGLFKDTSLLSLVGLLELTGIARTILAQPEFLGRYAEVYLFIGLIYWIFCYSMSLLSQKLETVNSEQ